MKTRKILLKYWVYRIYCHLQVQKNEKQWSKNSQLNLQWINSTSSQDKLSLLALASIWQTKFSGFSTTKQLQNCQFTKPSSSLDRSLSPLKHRFGITAGALISSITKDSGGRLILQTISSLTADCWQTFQWCIWITKKWGQCTSLTDRPQKQKLPDKLQLLALGYKIFQNLIQLSDKNKANYLALSYNLWITVYHQS